MEHKKYTVGLVSLGCDKNRVDSEIMLDIMKNRYKIVADPGDAEIIIVNTCGFIEDAKQESIDTILEMAKFKENGQCRLLMATGCLTQRYGEELMKEMPELDVIMGVNSYGRLKDHVDQFIATGERILDVDYSDSNINEGERILSDTLGSSAYLRISEGCSKNCTYCIIPKIRGAYRSRETGHILAEAEKLAKAGVSELIIIAQDTTMYGSDLYGKPVLHALLGDLERIEGIKWIRLMYMYPEGIYPELLETIAQSRKVLRYFDMPIQHVADSLLKRMGRRTTRGEVTAKIARIRGLMPDAILRTSLIVGFPGETAEEFEELLEFLQETKLDKVGVFTYSREEGTPAYRMKDQISQGLKNQRRASLMLLQQGISLEKNQAKIGRTYEVVVEGREEEFFTGRNFEMAPEIDGIIYIKTDKELVLGGFVNVKITGALEYDLIGELTNESSQ